MKRILVLTLAACLFLLPAFSLADARDTAMSIYVNEALASNETLAAAIDVINVLGFRAHTQEQQVVLAITLSGEDVLDFAFETDDNNLYLAGNLLGDQTLCVSIESLSDFAQQLPIPTNPNSSVNLNLDNTIAALMGAVEMGQSEITNWDGKTDKPDAAINISVSSENAVKVLDALKADLSAADLSNVTLPNSDTSAEDQIQKFIASCKDALPEGEFLSAEIGTTETGEVVYLTFQVSLIIENEDENKGAVVTIEEARTTSDSVLWDGGITVSVEGSDQRAYLATSIEVIGDSSKLDLVLYSVDDSDQMTPIGAFVRDAVHTATETGFHFESSNAIFTYDDSENPTEIGELHLLLAAESDTFTFNADVQTNANGPALVSLNAESKPSETEPTRITAQLYPVTEFTEETLGKIVEEVISKNIMTVAMGALTKLPPSAMSLATSLLGQ